MLRGFLPLSTAGRVIEVPSTIPDYALPTKPASAPTIAALETQAEAASANERAETMAMLPRLSVVANGEVNAPSPRAFAQTRLEPVPAWDVSIQLEWAFSALTVGGQNRRRASAEHDAALARVAEAKRRLDAERAAAVSTIRLARDRIEVASQRAQRAQKLAEARRAELEVGTALPADVVLAETELARAKIDLVDATIERALAHARLDLVDGRDTPSR
jgi:outer membrane protein TolC